MNPNLIHDMEVNDKNFDNEVINSKIPVLIEFWASWCVPCKVMEVVLKELALEYEGKIKITKLNVDRNRTTPKKYDITGVPTFLIFKNQKIISSKVGALSKNDLIKIIKLVI